MTNRKLLPVGTVIRLQETNDILMISTLFPLTEIEGNRGYFDFGGVALPLGVVSEELAFFNKEDIEEIIFMGYVEASFQQLQENESDIISKIDSPKLSLDSLKN